jgi:polysaccharide biosynthesis/export protein
MLIWRTKCIAVFYLWVALVTPTYAANSYLLGPGDEVRMTVYRQTDLTTEAQISAEGTLQLPLLGTVKLAGRSSAEAAEFIAEQYQRGNFLKQAQVNILITAYRSQSVAILGKVNRPGKLVLEGPTSMTEALAWAGGIADTGSEHLVLVRTTPSGKQERIEYDLQKLLNREAEQNAVVWLKNGDTLYVPITGRFYLSGEVRTPGMYALDRPLNVMQAIGVGGGPSARASKKAVTLFRQQINGSVKELRAKPEDSVLDGDLLVIQESLF